MNDVGKIYCPIFAVAFINCLLKTNEKEIPKQAFQMPIAAKCEHSHLNDVVQSCLLK